MAESKEPTVAPPVSSGGESKTGGGRGNRGGGGRGGSRPSSRNDNRRESASGSAGNPASHGKKPSQSSGGPGARDRRASHDRNADASNSRGGGNHSRRSSTQRGGGNGGGRGPTRKGSTDTGGASANEDRLRQVIGELKAMPSGSSSGDISPSGGDGNSPLPASPASAGGPVKVAGGRVAGGHRKNLSKEGGAAGGVKSTLNPNAGGFMPSGFQPGLSSISDVDAEVLITPAPDQTHFPLQPEAVMNPLSFDGSAFPGGFGMNPNGLEGLSATVQAQAMQVAQMQAALNATQQQSQQLGQNLPPRFAQQPNAMMMPAGMGGVDLQAMLAAGMLSPMSESLAIQQQLQMLQQQQENLMARYGQIQPGMAGSGSNESAPAQAAQAHRRGQSVQVGSGAMGSFGVGSNLGNIGGAAGAVGASGAPKGHGRRHSVQVGPKSTSMSPPMGVTGLNNPPMGFPQVPQPGGFSFPNAPSGAGPGGFNSFGGNGDGEFVGGFGAGGGGGGMGHRRGPSRGSISTMGGFQMDFGGGQSSVDLPQAQHQLQQLAQFRAASGHARVPSFGFQNPMNLGPGQSGFGGNNQQQMRKSLFAPYLPQASIPPLLAAGKLVIGTLRVNKRNRSDAYVATDALESDIYICGSKDRNRALEGDVVAVELLDVDEVWGTKKEKEEKKRKKEENQAFDPRAQQNMRREDKKRDDVEVEGQGLILFEEEEVNDDQRPNFAGHIVAVVERTPGQLFSGTLGLLRPSSAATKEKQEAERREREGVDLRGAQKEEQRPKIVWHRPTDKRVPLIAIPVDQAPADFLNDPSKYASTLFIAGIKRWPITSLHPFGTLVEELGPIGDIEVETNALLKDSNFSSEEFSDNVVRCLPPVPWTIPDREYEVRRDFRDKTVFTIDPESAKDLDDALHVTKLEDGNFEVGVHIADVTYFVKQNTALDREARKRATTVYLVQRAVPMLPPTLSEELCSLTPGQDKLTFSVVFKLTPDAKVLDTWYGKSIIHSTAKLAYSDAQEVIDGRSLPEVKLHKEGVTLDQVGENIKHLSALARVLRGRRFDDGCLRIDNVKLGFKLDDEGMPDDCKVFDRREANELIEEFMLMANIAVAHKIALGLPEQAFLRRHEPPIDRRLEAFVNRAKKLGFEIDTSSAGAMMRSFNSLETQGQAPQFVMQLLATKSMVQARYFCGGTLDIAKWHHYALNVPIYTHFTSPIRRFADIMVHRQLEAVLLASVDVKFSMDPESVSKVAQQCNLKKDAARLAQEQSQHLFLCILIAELTQKYGPVIRPATVIGVLDEAFDVAVADFGIEKRVHVDQMPIDNHVHDEHANTLKLYWKKGVDVVSYLSEHSNDAHLHSVRHHAERHARLMEASSQSVQAESALFDDDEDDDVVHPRKDGEGGEGMITDRERRSAQRMKSAQKIKPTFEGVEAIEAGPSITHHVQTVKELQTVPVIITADTSKSPPVIKIFAVNPFA